jgi:hypothetical protein
MVSIHIADGAATFRIDGLHKLWAFRSRIVVPVRDIVAVEGQEAVSRWPGWRVAGTWLPGALTAGTFRQNGQWTFWDVGQSSAAIVVTVRGHWYSRLIVEVAQPVESQQLLKQAMRDAHASPTDPASAAWSRARRAATDLS